ncbi:ATP-binding cassette domain-containing protein [Pseudomonas aeruginosa]|nr:ATP-binding cassette domain-containing protein [Pseudomonas aeruginosa]MCU8904692.1 ATP-binding cassette domain-containing protein [Pseudomonas aeruginosa]MCU8961703.1 ATP-binding cassette domain-containing protein [Pseudomonas aeruginosa]MCU9513046.1 ATP-binding cassette domain-containing protein [Pseudomonas aeruginosa]
MRHAIEVRGLDNRFGTQQVHQDLDLDVRRGEILGVVGGSGTGKSVLLRSVVGCSAARNSSACCAINPTRLVFQWWKRNFRIARRVPPGYPN